MNRLPLLDARVGEALWTRRILALLVAALLLTGCSAADAKGAADTVAKYESALAPLKKRSDVLEKKFASVQGAHYRGPRQMRRVLAAIIPQYAELLDETKAIDVEGPDLEKAQAALVASLERQQRGLELALRGIDHDDRTMLSRAGRELERAQDLVVRHRRLLADARRQQAG
jgi:hypothetical protein